MARRREFDVFSWAFLDVITSGFGAIVLMFIIINTQVHSRADQASKELKSETDRLEEEVLDGRKNLVRLRNSLVVRTEERDVTRGQAERIREILARLRDELSKTEADSLARKASAEQLRSDIEQLEESNRRLAARAAEQNPGTGQKLRGFLGQGNRQYITGMKMNGSRVLILVDASTSMLARTYVNVVRFRNMPEEQRLRAPKWQQTVKAVEWITTQIKPGTKVQIYAFNEQAHSVLPGTDGKWIEVRDGKELDPAIAALKKIVPDKGTSLINAFDTVRALDPVPDSVFLLTDGLPTQGKSAPPQREEVRADRRATYFTQAERTLSRRIPFNILLFPMDGDPDAPGYFWDLAVYTGGALLTPTPGLALMPKQRRDIQIFSLYFLDGMCCAFGAVIMLLLITKQSEPHIIEQSRVHEAGLIAALQKELFELRGETDVLDRQMKSLEVDVNASRGLLENLQQDLTKIRGRFAASRENAMQSDVQGQLMAARQQLTEEMRRLLANYKPPENDTTIGGIPVDSEYIIFIIDNSGSMYQGPWRLVMRKITETLNVYPRVKGIQVMNNDGRYLMSSYAGKWIPDSQAIRGRIISALANFTAFSDSNPTEGIIEAVNTFYEPGKKISIYYMGDDFPEGQVEAVARYVEKINKSDEFGNRLVRIHAIGFPTQIAGGQMVNAARFSNLMRTLCERNGGSFIALSTLD